MENNKAVRFGLDGDGYPTDEMLEDIRNYTGRIVDFFRGLKAAWWYEFGWDEEPFEEDGHPNLRFHMATGGWSGNESTIGAMEDNWMLWSEAWVQSRVGGGYTFEFGVDDEIHATINRAKYRAASPEPEPIEGTTQNSISRKSADRWHAAVEKAAIEGTKESREPPQRVTRYHQGGCPGNQNGYTHVYNSQLNRYEEEVERQLAALQPPIAAAPEWLDDLDDAAHEVRVRESYFKEKTTEVWQAADAYPALKESRERYAKLAKPAAILELIKLVRPRIAAAGSTRNSEALDDFTAYCKANPQERFWQALRNWSRFHFIYGSDSPQVAFHAGYVSDTFNLEGLEGKRAALPSPGERK